MPNGTENSRNFQISGKSDNLEWLTKIFEMNFAKISVPIDSVPEFLEFLVEWKAPLVPSPFRVYDFQDNVVLFIFLVVCSISTPQWPISCFFADTKYMGLKT